MDIWELLIGYLKKKHMSCFLWQ